MEKRGVIFKPITATTRSAQQSTAPSWRGQKLDNVSFENYTEPSKSGKSGKKITLSSTDGSESFIFNTATDKFYAIGDYVVINRQECDEERRTDEPDGRTIVLGKQKFQEILKEAYDNEYTKVEEVTEHILDKPHEDNFRCDTPKKVIDLIGPKIFEERGFLLVKAMNLGLDLYDLEISYDMSKSNCEYYEKDQWTKEVGLSTESVRE